MLRCPLAGICHVRWYGYHHRKLFCNLSWNSALRWNRNLDINFLYVFLRAIATRVYSYDNLLYGGMFCILLSRVLIFDEIRISPCNALAKRMLNCFLTMYFWMRNLTTARNYLEQTLRPNLEWYDWIIAFFMCFESIIIHKFHMHVNDWLLIDRLINWLIDWLMINLNKTS